MLTFLSQTVHYVLFMDSQILLFSNFFIKNGSYGTIYTFKNYFTTVISAISFQFQQNKSYPNRPFIRWFSLVPRLFEIKCQFGLGSISRLHFVLRLFFYFFIFWRQLQQGTVAIVINSNRTFLTFSSLCLFIYFRSAAVGNSGYCYEQ